MQWVMKSCEDIGNAGRLKPMYSLAGHRISPERPLEHFEGYRHSRPVTIGNNAEGQLQIDVYGELADFVHYYNNAVEPISYDFWLNLEKHLNWLSQNWSTEDEGIWEVRGGKRAFLFSRLMCWVAFDRMIKIGDSRSFPYPQQWIATRDKIFKSIYDEFWNEELQTFVQFRGARTVDAATLLMPLMGLISHQDRKWLFTLKTIERELVSDSLVFRYRHEDAKYDPISTEEGTFSMCTFWHIQCLCRSGQLHKARFYFEKMLGYANNLGLYAEELSFAGEQLGNFPQAFTHLALIKAAKALDQSFQDERNKGGEVFPFPSGGDETASSSKWILF